MQAITGKEKLSSLRAKMNELCKDMKYEDPLCQFALLFGDGSWRVATSDVCYARVRYSTYEDRGDDPCMKELVFSFNPFFWKGNNKDIAKAYVIYIVNKCPIFKDLFLVKKSPNYWDKGMYVNTEKPLSLIMMGLISIRQVWENPYVVDSFNFLVKNKVSPLIAYLLAESFRVMEKNVMEMNSDGHKAFGQTLTFEGMKRLIKEGVTKSLPPAKGGTFYSVFEHNGTGYAVVGTHIRPVLFKGTKKEGKGWGVKHTLSIDKFLANVKEIEKELLA